MKDLELLMQISAQVQLQLEQYVRAHFPDPPRFVEKYEEAVSTLARVQPIQAFRLRNQPLILPFLDELRGLAASELAGSEFWKKVVEPELARIYKPHLEELILDVAKAHGWRTWWHARRQLKKQISSERDEAQFAEYISMLKSAPPSGGPPPMRPDIHRSE